MDFFGIEQDQLEQEIRHKKEKAVAKSTSVHRHCLTPPAFVASSGLASEGSDRLNITSELSNQQYFEGENKSSASEESGLPPPSAKDLQFDGSDNYVDRVYFDTSLNEKGENKFSTSEESELPPPSAKDLQFDGSDNYVDRVYFDTSLNETQNTEGIRKNRNDHGNLTGSIRLSTRTRGSERDEKVHLEPPAGIMKNEDQKQHEDRTSLQFSPLKSTGVRIDEDGRKKPFMKIADVVQGLREKTGINLYSGTTLDIPSNRSERYKTLKRDSQGYRVPDDDAIKFSLLSEEEAAAALCKSIIEVRDNIIIINKPYGIASHPGPGHKHSISELLPQVEHYVRSKISNTQSGSSLRAGQTLTLVHRLDKESTGLMLIARNQEASLKLKEAFANRWIKKDYLCITVGIPSSSQGYIRLPLVERNFNGVFKMCVAPLGRRTKQSSCDILNSNEDSEFKGPMNWDEMESVCGESNVPTTFYKTLDRRNDAALLMCSTLSGLKHQIRVHLAFGLHTPILGDHKYSHASYLAPQRLPHCLLDRLEIRQSKVRYMVLHLHAHRMRLRCTQTERAGKQNTDAHFFDFATSGSHASQSSLVFSANPPNYFVKNLRLIGLNLPRFLSKI